MHIVIDGRNNRPSAAEPTVTFTQSLASGLAIATFVIGGLLVMAGVV